MENDSIKFGIWIPIEDIKEFDLNQCNIMHCDTRDFHAIMHEDQVDSKKIDQLSSKDSKKFEKYKISQKEIIAFLKNLEERTGGVSDWRYLFNIKDESRQWIKYIRFFRLDKNNFVVMANEKGLDWKDLLENIPSIKDLNVD